jgi:hypothetical protein
MFDYFQAHTYLGPDAEEKLTLARNVATEPATALATWTQKNMPATHPGSAPNRVPTSRSTS